MLCLIYIYISICSLSLYIIWLTIWIDRILPFVSTMYTFHCIYIQKGSKAQYCLPGCKRQNVSIPRLCQFSRNIYTIYLYKLRVKMAPLRSVWKYFFLFFLIKEPQVSKGPGLIICKLQVKEYFW